MSANKTTFFGIGKGVGGAIGLDCFVGVEGCCVGCCVPGLKRPVVAELLPFDAKCLAAGIKSGSRHSMHRFNRFVQGKQT